MTELLTLVKSTNVLLIVKMLGEKNTVQTDIHPSIVIAHSGLPHVMVLGIVTIFTISLLMS